MNYKINKLIWFKIFGAGLFFFFLVLVSGFFLKTKKIECVINFKNKTICITDSTLVLESVLFELKVNKSKFHYNYYFDGFDDSLCYNYSDVLTNEIERSIYVWIDITVNEKVNPKIVPISLSYSGEVKRQDSVKIYSYQ